MNDFSTFLELSIVADFTAARIVRASKVQLTFVTAVGRNELYIFLNSKSLLVPHKTFPNLPS